MSQFDEEKCVLILLPRGSCLVNPPWLRNNTVDGHWLIWKGRTVIPIIGWPVLAIHWLWCVWDRMMTR